MSILEAKQPGPVHHAIAWALMIGGMGWGLAQCVPSTSSTPTDPSKPSGGIDKISLRSTHYRREAFDTVFVATFAIHNDNDYAVKDVVVTCHHAAPSGTFIDKNTRTVFEKIPARGYTYVRDFNMGFVVAQASRTACVPTAFSSSQ